MERTTLQNMGEMIRKERISRGMTQDELGKLVGVGKAQISKIENGTGLTIKTVNKVLAALNLTTNIEFVPSSKVSKNMIGYCVASISEFGKKHSLSPQEASNYLNRFRGIDFLVTHYEAEHLLSFDDSTNDLTRVCFNNGGGLQ